MADFLTIPKYIHSSTGFVTVADEIAVETSELPNGAKKMDKSLITKLTELDKTQEIEQINSDISDLQSQVSELSDLGDLTDTIEEIKSDKTKAEQAASAASNHSTIASSAATTVRTILGGNALTSEIVRAKTDAVNEINVASASALDQLSTHVNKLDRINDINSAFYDAFESDNTTGDEVGHEGDEIETSQIDSVSLRKQKFAVISEAFFNANKDDLEDDTIYFCFDPESLDLDSQYYYVTVQSDNYDYGDVAGNDSYKVNTQATVKAIPKQGYSFIRWTDLNDQTVSEDLIYTFTVTGNTNLKAHFELAESYYTVSVVSDNTVGGYASFSNTNLVTTKLCSNQDYVNVYCIHQENGSWVEGLKDGFSIIGWKLNDTDLGSDTTTFSVQGESVITLKLRDNRIINVSHSISPLTINSQTLDDDEIGTVYCSSIMMKGDASSIVYAVSAMPDLIQFTSWSYSNNTSTQNPLSLQDQTNDINITANFNIIDGRTLKIASASDGEYDTSINLEVAANSQVTCFYKIYSEGNAYSDAQSFDFDVANESGTYSFYGCTINYTIAEEP